MEWLPGSVVFRTADQYGTTLHNWTWSGQAPRPDSDRLNFRLNLWLISPPSNGQEVEVVVSAFSFENGPFEFVPMTPCRIVDTRNADGPFGGPILPSHISRNFSIPFGSCQIPGDAVAYALNATVVPETTLGYLTLWPSGTERPLVSTLNSIDGRVKAVAAIVPAGASAGGISAYATDRTHIIVDVNGYFRLSALDTLQFYPLAPCRLLDTRDRSGIAGGGRLAQNEARSFVIPAGSCGVPLAARAYSLNVTVVPQAPLGYLTMWPAGRNRPLASTLNAPFGEVTANAAIVPADDFGGINVYVTDPTDVVLDINGYFAPRTSGGLSFYNLPPCRLADTRGPAGPYGAPMMASNQPRGFALTAATCRIPQTAGAISLNATVVPHGLLGYLTLWPHLAQPQPTVSTLNALDGIIASNAAIVPIGNGSVAAYASHNTELILDLNGYFAP
jgi:hypothetical protein